MDIWESIDFKNKQIIIEMQRTILFTLLFSITVCTLSCNSKSGHRKAKIEITQSKIQAEFLPVTKVVDGDTFWADDGTKKGVKIRLIGVDTPESRNMFNIKKEYFGIEAKKYMKKLLKGKKVRLEYDVDKLDRYGRTLAYIYLIDGTFVNAELVKKGYGKVMTVPPNVKYADSFVNLQREAKENNRGLWQKYNNLNEVQR